MRNLKYLSSLLAICVFACLGIALIVYVFKPEIKPSQSLSPAIVAKTASQRLDPSAVAQGGFVRADLNLSAADIARARDKQQMVEVLRFEQIQHQPEFIFKRTDPAQQIYLRYDPHVIETRKVGEQVQFTVPALGVDYQLQIENMQAIDQDIMRWEGHVLAHDAHTQSQGQRFSVMQSQKDRYSIIQIQSDQGMISAEIKNGLGIISNTPIDHGQDQVHTPAEI